MTNLLILLTLPEPVRNQYRDRLQARFPELNIALVDHHSKVGPYIGAADALLTFAPMLSDRCCNRRTRLKWVQALGTGVDNLIDRPCLRNDVIVTNVHGIHGPPVSEAAIAAMLALARNLPRAVRSPGEAAMAALPGAASAQQDGRHFRHRRHRRSAGAQMQGLRHARRRRKLRPARSWPASIACIRARSLPRWRANSTSSCCSPR